MIARFAKVATPLAVVVALVVPVSEPADTVTVTKTPACATLLFDASRS